MRRNIGQDRVSLEWLQPVVDGLAVAAAGLLAWLVIGLAYPAIGLSSPQLQYRYVLVLAVVVAPTVFAWMGVYRSWRGIPLQEELRSVWWGWGAFLMVVAVLVLATKTGRAFSRLWLASWFLSGLLTLSLGRVFMRMAMDRARTYGFNRRRVVLIGGEQIARRVIAQLRANPWLGLEVVGIFEDRDVGPEVDNVPVLGRFADALPYLNRTRNVDQVWLAMPLRAEQRMRDVLAQLRHSTVDICFVPDIYGFQLLNHTVREIAGMPVLQLTASPLTGVNRILKALEDRVLAFWLFVVLLPLMLLIALAIRLDSPGPVVFKQKRHGWDGKPINVYKFRSMYLHQEEGGVLVQASADDPRVTRLGRFLRRSSLDELPQLYNVLQGRMSLVGPRPHALQHNEQYKDVVDRYMLRHKVKPGMTGWAQVNGYRGETDTLSKMQKRVEYDLYYIEHWSLWLDFKILLLTALHGFFGKNAY